MVVVLTFAADIVVGSERDIREGDILVQSNSRCISYARTVGGAAMSERTRVRDRKNEGESLRSFYFLTMGYPRREILFAISYFPDYISPNLPFSPPDKVEVELSGRLECNSRILR